MGRTIGETLWAKLRKQGGCILPESMQDVRDAAIRRGFHPGEGSSLAEIRAFARDDQGGDLAIWGTVERAEGSGLDEYVLHVRVADLRSDPPRLLVDERARTATVSEIPHVHLQAALDAVAAATNSPRLPPAPGARPRPDAPAGPTGPNLVRGDFDQGDDHPEGWDVLGPGVLWTADPRKPGNRLIRFTQGEDVAGTTGVLYYSDFFPVQEGATYRFRCRWKTSGSTVKVFIKAYDQFPSRERDAAGRPLKAERREVYRSQQNLQGPAGEWNEHEQSFTPTHSRYTPRWARVMLYAYWPAGTVEWDEVEVVQLAAPAAPPARPRAAR